MTTNGQAQTTDPAHPNEYTTVLPQEILVERVFPAPRELVFRVWTECEHLQHWWGPTGWTLPHCTVDLRPGGKWHYCMQGPDGTEAWGLTLYREIVRPERLVYTDAFSDAEGKMNASVTETGGEALVVSQFTLHASTKKGNRPSFIRAAKPEVAVPLYEKFLAQLETEIGRPVERGVFGADMKVSLVNDGPVTIWMDTKARE